MTDAQQRRLGAVVPDVVSSPAMSLPTSVGEFEGWTVDDLVSWLRTAGEQHAVARIAIGLALWALLDRQTEDEHKAVVGELAALYDVDRTTLWRWRKVAQAEHNLPEPKGALNRSQAQKAVRASKAAAPEVGCSVQPNAESDSPLRTAERSEPAIPSSTIPSAPRATTGTAVESLPLPVPTDVARLAVPANPTIPQVLRALAVCSAEEMATAGLVDLRDCANRLNLAVAARMRVNRPSLARDTVTTHFKGGSK